MKKIKFKHYLPISLALFIMLSALIFAVFKSDKASAPTTQSTSSYQNQNITNEPTKNDSQTTTDSQNTAAPKTIQPIPILMYHYIRNLNDPTDQIGTNLSVSPEIFDQELQIIKNSGYQSINLDQYLNNQLPAKPIIFSFDDGYDNAYSEAFNLLKKYGFNGTFYVITNKIGTSGYLTESQIKEMSSSGMTIGDHTLSHPNLSTASPATVKKEITLSKSRLETITGTSISNFCYPSGKYNQSVIDLLKEAGFKTATTTKSPAVGFNNYFELPRIRVSSTDSPAGLLKKVQAVK